MISRSKAIGLNGSCRNISININVIAIGLNNDIGGFHGQYLCLKALGSLRLTSQCKRLSMWIHERKFRVSKTFIHRKVKLWNCYQLHWNQVRCQSLCKSCFKGISYRRECIEYVIFSYFGWPWSNFQGQTPGIPSRLVTCLYDQSFFCLTCFM